MAGDSATINQKTYSLHELMLSIQSVLTKTYASRQYWIRCEVSRISLHAQSGHCYLELIDKNENSIVAQLRAMIWSDRYSHISRNFEEVTRSPISNGMKLLLSCSVNFHPLHGLSLTIHDIEPSFTLGEMARSRNNSIARLKSEGLFNRNKTITLPLFPGRIAVISVGTSRGYHDFLTTIIHYQKKYAIRHTLFEAILQGDNAIPSLSGALQKIIAQKNKFDAIAIIRGGAGDAGLSCYDEYSLASLVANSPLPIITGIGHATNETVSEMVAHKNCITPTAAANFLIEKFDNLQDSIDRQIQVLDSSIKKITTDQKSFIHQTAQRISLFVRNKLEYQHFTLAHAHSLIPGITSRYLITLKNNVQHNVQFMLNIKKYGTYQLSASSLNNTINTLQIYSRQQIENNKEQFIQKKSQLSNSKSIVQTKIMQLEHTSEKISLLDPVNTLKRGYSITRLNGKAITSPEEATPGATLETQLAGGTLTSHVHE